MQSKILSTRIKRCHGKIIEKVILEIMERGATEAESYKLASSPPIHVETGTCLPTVPPVRIIIALDWLGKNVRTGGSNEMLGEEKARVILWGVG